MSQKLLFDSDNFQFIPFNTKGFMGKRAENIAKEARIIEDGVFPQGRKGVKFRNKQLSGSEWFDEANGISMGKMTQRHNDEAFRNFPTILGSGEQRHFSARIKTIKGVDHDLELSQDTLHNVILQSDGGHNKMFSIKIQEVYYGDVDFIRAMTTGMQQSHSKASKSAYILYSILPRDGKSVDFDTQREVLDRISQENVSEPQ